MYSTLKAAAKKTLKETFKSFGIGVTRYHRLRQLEREAGSSITWTFPLTCPEDKKSSY
jgi:hypothetical protein